MSIRPQDGPSLPSSTPSLSSMIVSVSESASAAPLRPSDRRRLRLQAAAIASGQQRAESLSSTASTSSSGGISSSTVKAIVATEPLHLSVRGREVEHKPYADWRPPSWRRSVPASLADVRPQHRHLAYNWLIDRGYIVGGPFDSPVKERQRWEVGWKGLGDYTLSFLSGNQEGQKGAWFPHSEWPVFLGWLAIDLRFMATTPLYYNQILSQQELCRFTLDGDFKGSKPETPATLLRIIQSIQRQVLLYRPHHPNTTLLVTRNAPVRCDPSAAVQRAIRGRKLVSEATMLSRNGNCAAKTRNDVMAHIDERRPELLSLVRWKEGLHLHWDFFCTATQALQIRRSAVDALVHEFGERPEGFNSWEELLDAGPTAGFHLRLLGSGKTEACPICDDEKVWKECRAVCPGCFGHGKVPEGRVYKPYLVLRGSQVSEESLLAYATRPEQLLNDVSLHAPVGQGSSFHDGGGFRVPEGHRKLPQETDRLVCREVQLVNGGRGRYESTDSVNKQKVLAHMCHHREYLLSDDPKVVALQEFIRTCLPEQYAQLKITTVFTTPRRAFFNINVQGYGERYCQAIAGEHNSNTIYFYIRGKQFFQKCYCRCVGKPCFVNGQPYQSEPLQLPVELSRVLYREEPTNPAEAFSRAVTASASTLGTETTTALSTPASRRAARVAALPPRERQQVADMEALLQILPPMPSPPATSTSRPPQHQRLA